MGRGLLHLKTLESMKASSKMIRLMDSGNLILTYIFMKETGEKMNISERGNWMTSKSNQFIKDPSGITKSTDMGNLNYKNEILNIKEILNLMSCMG